MADEGFSVQITGLDEAMQALDDFTAKFAASAMKKAMKAGARVIADEAKALCPVAPPGFTATLYYGARKGDLRRSIRVDADVDKRTGTVKAWVKAGSSSKKLTSYYATWVEFGTAGHYIKPKNHDALKFGGGFAAKLKHPGAVKKPFMRPAMDGKLNAAFAKVAEVLSDSIEKKLADLDAAGSDGGQS